MVCEQFLNWVISTDVSWLPITSHVIVITRRVKTSVQICYSHINQCQPTLHQINIKLYSLFQNEWDGSTRGEPQEHIFGMRARSGTLKEQEVPATQNGNVVSQETQNVLLRHNLQSESGEDLISLPESHLSQLALGNVSKRCHESSSWPSRRSIIPLKEPQLDQWGGISLFSLFDDIMSTSTLRERVFSWGTQTTDCQNKRHEPTGEQPVSSMRER